MLTMRDIIRGGHSTLRRKATELELPLTKEEKEALIVVRESLINSQDEEIAKRHGLRSDVGLAAPQINISKRTTAVLIPDDGSGKSYDYMLVNPKIVSHSVRETYLPAGEGCLSVDDNIAGLVHRRNRTTVKAKDIEGNDIQLWLRGYPTAIFQYKIDHLNGVMLYDHIDKDHPLQPHAGTVGV